MQTSTSTTAISFFSRHSSASVAEFALIRFSPRLAQDRLVGQQLRWLIVDQQDVDPVDPRRGGHVVMSVLYRCSHIRSADSSCSVLTGFAR